MRVDDCTGRGEAKASRRNKTSIAALTNGVASQRGLEVFVVDGERHVHVVVLLQFERSNRAVRQGRVGCETGKVDAAN